MQVLIADDCPDICDLLSVFLQQEGYQVDCALTPERVLELVPAQYYDVILLDLWIPDMDGYMLAKEVRRRYDGRCCPRIIALSGAPYDPSHPCATAAAFDSFVAKPVDVPMLAQALASSESRPTFHPKSACL